MLARHRKVLFLAHDLGADPVHIVGHLHVFWHAILEQQEDGDLSAWPVEMIAQAAGWKHDAEQFVSALKRNGWLDDHLVHDWLEYTGKYLHAKYSTSNVQRLKDIYERHGYKYGKGNKKDGKLKAQGKRKSSANQAPLNQPLPNQPLPNQPNLTKPKEEKKEEEIKTCGQVKILPAPAKSAATWGAYANAYRCRYGVEPPRNKRTNALLCQVVDRLGTNEAPSVAEFYLSHNSPLYVRGRHPPDLLVRDCEGLRTQWATGNKATSSEVRQAESRDDASEQVKRVEAMLAKGL